MSINTLHKDDDDDDDNNNKFNCKWAVVRWQWLLCTYINKQRREPNILRFLVTVVGRGGYILWSRNWVALINTENMQCLVSWKEHKEQPKTLLVQQNTEKVSNTGTLPDLRISCVPAGPAQVGTEYTHGQLFTVCVYKSVQFQSKLQHTGNCYRPTVFFRHLSLIALSLPQEKFGPFQKRYLILSLLFLILRVWNYVTWRGVGQGVSVDTARHNGFYFRSILYIYIYVWAGRSGIESRWGRDFPPVQTGPGAHPASCKMGTSSFPGIKCGRGVLLSTHPLPVPRSWKSRAIPLPTLWVTPGL